MRAAHRLLVGKVYARLGEQHSAQLFFLNAVEDRREQRDRSLLAEGLTDLAENSLYCCYYFDSHEAAREAVELFGDADSEYAQRSRRLAHAANTCLELRNDVWKTMAECHHLEEALKFKQRLEANPDFKPAGVINGLLAMLFADVGDFEFAEKVCMMQPLRYDLGHETTDSNELPALFANGKTQRDFGLGFLAAQNGNHLEAQEHYKAVLEQMTNHPEGSRENEWVEPLYAWALLHQDNPSEKDVLKAEARSQVFIDYVGKYWPDVMPSVAAVAYHTNALAKSKRGDLESSIKSQKIALEKCQHPGHPRHLLLSARRGGTVGKLPPGSCRSCCC